MCAAAAAALTLTACLPGDNGGEESSTSGSSTGSEGGEGSGDGGATPYEATEESFAEPEQHQLTKAEAKKALPTRGDMPDKTWLTDTSTFSDSEETYDPKECAALEFDSASARAFRDTHRKVDESARFSQYQGDGGGIIATYVESHSTPYPLAYFDEAGESLSSCSEYTISRDGHTTTNEASAIPPPSLGERSFGVRISNHDYHVDRLFVRSGHNLITVMILTRDDDYDERLLEKYAQGVLTDLKKDS